MEDNLNILPPDKDIFHEKKVPSNKQKEHLVKARAAARDTIERRRRLEKEEKNREERKDDKKENNIDLSTTEKIVEDNVEESESDDSPPPVRKGKKIVPRHRELTAEELEAHRFDKFMKQMNNYEKAKLQHAKDAEEAKKVKLSLNQDEYTYLQGLIEADAKREELAKQNPAEPKKVVEPVSQQALIRNLKFNQGGKSRFGS